MNQVSILAWAYFAAVILFVASCIWYVGRKRRWGRLSRGMLLAAAFILIASVLFVEGASLGIKP